MVFIINVTGPAVAHEMLEKLPLGKASMMSFELIPDWPAEPASSRSAKKPRALRSRSDEVAIIADDGVEVLSFVVF